MSFCESQFPHKSVNSSFIIINIRVNLQVLSLRGDLGVLRSQLEKARTDVVSAEVRYHLFISK